MPRRREVPKRDVLPDPIYQSQLVTKFINCVMERGKKSLAEGIFYGAMKQIEEKTQDEGVSGDYPDQCQGPNRRSKHQHQCEQHRCQTAKRQPYLAGNLLP